MACFIVALPKAAGRTLSVLLEDGRTRFLGAAAGGDALARAVGLGGGGGGVDEPDEDESGKDPDDTEDDSLPESLASSSSSMRSARSARSAADAAILASFLATGGALLPREGAGKTIVGTGADTPLSLSDEKSMVKSRWVLDCA